MAERPRQDSSRDLLEELEDGWASAPASSKGAAASAVPEAGDSAPDVNELDEGWLDQLFPEEEDDDEEEESEPELPDERLDPVAFAEAKKALAERQAAKKERKKQKLEAKRARQRAKAVALRQKQKGKSKRKPAPPTEREREKAEKAERKAAARAARAASQAEEREASAAEADDAIGEVSPRRKTSIAPAAKQKKAPPNTMQSIKLLAIVLAVLLAGAAIIAVLKSQ